MLVGSLNINCDYEAGTLEHTHPKEKMLSTMFGFQISNTYVKANKINKYINEISKLYKDKSNTLLIIKNFISFLDMKIFINI